MAVLHPGKWHSVALITTLGPGTVLREKNCLPNRGYWRKPLARVTEALRCKFKGLCLYYTLRTRCIACVLIRRAVGVREATVSGREAIMLGRDLLIDALLLLLSQSLFIVVRRKEGGIFITVKTCDYRVFPVKRLCW